MEEGAKGCFMTSKNILTAVGGTVLCAAVLAGCAGKKMSKADDANRPEIPNEAKLMPKAVPPPEYPKAKPMAIDTSLRDKSRKEIATNYGMKDTDPRDPTPQIQRANAIEAMRQVPRKEDEPVIIAALDDPSGLVRKSAALAVGELRLAAALPKLQQMVQTEDSRVNVAVKFALHRLGDTTHSHDFEDYARDPDIAVRSDTAIVLGLLGERSAVVILKVMIRDSAAIVRLQASEAMWRLNDEAGLDDLIGATLSRYTDDQMIAFLALAEPRDHRVIEHVRGGLTTDFPETNLVAARAMGMLGSDEGYGVATQGAKSDDPRRRALACFAFGAIGRSDSQPILSKLLDDPHPQVRLAAAVAVLQLKPY